MSRMKRVCIVLGVAGMLFAAGAHSSGAESSARTWSPRSPSWPALEVDLEPELCANALRRAEEWFASEAANSWSLEDQLPDVEVVDFGEEIPFERGGVHFKELDLDGNETTERILIFRSFFRDRDHFDGLIVQGSVDVALPLDTAGIERILSVPPGVSQFPGDEARSRPGWIVEPTPLYRWKGRFYFSGTLRSPAESGFSLYRLEADGSTPLVCLVKSAEAVQVAGSMLQLPEVRTLVKALAAIGTSGRAYCGTLYAGDRHDGWAWGSVHRAATRPWADPVSDPDNVSKTRYFEYSARMWRFLETWAANDVWNEREYLTLRQALEPARRAYANYLSREFGLNDNDARAKGDTALERMIASWFLIPISFDTEGWPGPASGLSRTRVSLDPAAQNSFGKTNLMMAAHMNRLDLVRELLKRGADPKAATRPTDSYCEYNVQRGGRTALTYAAENASPLVMKVLLDAGAEPDVTDTEGNRFDFYLKRNPRLTEEQRKLSIVELAATAATLADAPGFDCSRARRRAERAICAEEALRLLDSEMTAAYARAIGKVSPALKVEQGRWIAARENDCAKANGDDYKECLADATAARVRFLHYLAEPVDEPLP